MNNMEELVFAFPTDGLWKLLTYEKNGLIKGNSEVLKTIVQNGQFLRRSELEEDPSFKKLFRMQLSLIKNRSEAEFGKANHFIYSGGDPGRQKKDCTINSL
jgi:predicted NUDIX family phosphoesterase